MRSILATVCAAVGVALLVGCGGSTRWNSRPSWIWPDAAPASRANIVASSHLCERLRGFMRPGTGAATLGLRFSELLAGFTDEKVGSGQHCLARCARDDDVAALHRESRDSLEPVGAAHL